MIVTEEEARQKWCPWVRQAAEGGGTFNRGSENDNPLNDRIGEQWEGTHGCRCIASACMAWRWIKTHVTDPAGGPDLVLSHETYGLCGLAGNAIKPHDQEPHTRRNG